MLELLREKARLAGLSELHIPVERKNLPSAQIIKANGGEYERSFSHQGKQADIYQFKL